jgi:hypothetical protein
VSKRVYVSFLIDYWLHFWDIKDFADARQTIEDKIACPRMDQRLEGFSEAQPKESTCEVAMIISLLGQIHNPNVHQELWT